MRGKSLYAASLAMALAGIAYGAVQHSLDPETSLESWQWQGKEVSITFNQRLPDQSRAYFQGRGFAPEHADEVADACVFQTIIRNSAEAHGPMTLDLADWRVAPADGEPRPLRLEADWQEAWERAGVSQPARIAFRWSLFPTRQSFQPGDWNMGMITAGLPAGAVFDLELSWQQAGELHEARFEGMRCAPDRHL